MNNPHHMIEFIGKPAAVMIPGKVLWLFEYRHVSLVVRDVFRQVSYR